MIIKKSIFILVGSAICLSRCHKNVDTFGEVDVMIGSAKTDYELAQNRSRVWNEAYGNVAPFVGTPHGMTHWTVETQRSTYKCISPFYAADRAITGVRISHWLSGSCTQDYGSVTILPVLVDNNVLDAFPKKLMEWASENTCSGSKYIMRCRKPRACNVSDEGLWCYRTQNTKRSPAYYSTGLLGGDYRNVSIMHIGFTASSRAGIMKIRLPRRSRKKHLALVFIGNVPRHGKKDRKPQVQLQLGTQKCRMDELCSAKFTLSVPIRQVYGRDADLEMPFTGNHMFHISGAPIHSQ
jgi:putative alpha-1,2-mannosidase